MNNSTNIEPPLMTPNTMKHIRSASTLLWLGSCLTLPAADTDSAAPQPPKAIYCDASLAMNHPDEFAWRMFVEICRPVEKGEQTAQWETWADQEMIFADPMVAPVWPSTESAPTKKLKPPRQQAIRSAQVALKPLPDDRDPSGNEEVRDNRVAFDYIVANELWYQEGILAKAETPTGIQFPQESVSVKARWKYIKESEKSRYHWASYRSNEGVVTVGLTALHIASKVIPNWHWSTFEHVDNPGMGDFIGVHDRYGLNPPDIYPNAVPNQGYEGGTLKPVVVKLMKDMGLPEGWQHYRLKGSQADFTDSTGRVTLLGNSITEAGFVASSSCITCHARASRAPLHAKEGQPMHLPVFDPQGLSYHGPVQSDWFWFASGNANHITRPDIAFHQLDFLWQLAVEPKSRVN